MSLQIYIAHTGEQMLADPVSFASPDALRSWISQRTSIPSQRQILMTARGRNVKLQNLATENEIFVYDRQFVSEQTVGELPQIPAPQPFNPEDPPDSLADQNNLQAWRDLYMARRSWALNIAVKCGPIVKVIDEHNERTDVIHRGVGVALENLKSHVGSLEHKFQEAQNWANDLLKEQQSVLKDWQRAVTKLEDIPAKNDVSFLRRPSTPKKAKDRHNGTLQDYIDVDQTKHAASQVAQFSKGFARRIDGIKKNVHDIASKTEILITETAQAAGPDDAHGLLDEVETIARKISSDYEHILGLPNSSKTLSNVSRMALNHTKDLLPSMLEISLEIQTGLEHAVKDRNATVRTAIKHMQAISSTESQLSKVRNEISNLDADTDGLDNLYIPFHLPVIYGSILIESVRRREWIDKIKTDSMTLAEELAVLRDEEQRRRKKWAKRMSDFIPATDDGPPGVEVNLQGGSQETEWPEITRKDIEMYIEDLKTKDGMQEAVQELSTLFKDLDLPTRQQRRRAKAFKNGSVVEMGRSSFLLQGDDMVRGLQEEKTKLEDRLKGSESRVRRLEDLLHRQSHISRPVSGHFGPDVPISPASPRPDAVSRRSSVSSRRMSLNQPQEENKIYVQRIVALEAELASEKETTMRLQREASHERQANFDRIEEAQLTKNDLVKNLEAQQREFEGERKFLESETSKYKIKVEELEEELDKVMDIRDQERHEADEKIESLQEELEEVTQNSVPQEAEKRDVETQSDLSSQNKELHERIQKADESQRDWCHTLQAAHHHLSPDGSPPEDLSNLVKTIEILAEGLAIHAKGADDTAMKMNEENKCLTQKISEMENKIDHLIDSLADAESELDQSKSKLEEAQEDLEIEKNRFKDLNSKLVTDESGAEVLKGRIAEEEQKVAALNEQISTIESQKSTFENDLLAWKTKIEDLENAKSTTTSWFNARGDRAGELSSKVHVFVEQLSRILEQLGFTIVFQDNVMTIQRTSKVNSGSVLGDSLASSGFIPRIQDPELMMWMRAVNEEEESSKFAAFVAAVSRLDLQACGDAVIKRVKDIETLARKWQKEARLYRDKCHRAQGDSHDKIAYRSFKEGDLALFLPTRNQAIRPWAAFNVGAPHYFLREQDAHKLQNRDWLLARITKVEERVVDLSKSINGLNPNRNSVSDTSLDDDNPFELSDGLRWYLLDAAEEKPRAPSTPGLGKSTVASAHVDAKGSIRLKRGLTTGGATKTLTKSLDSRRNSSTSKKGTPILRPTESAGDNVLPAEGDLGAEGRREQAPVFDEGMDQSTVEGDYRPPYTHNNDTAGVTEFQSPTSPSSSKTNRPSKTRPWERLFSLDYRSDTPGWK